MVTEYRNLSMSASGCEDMLFISRTMINKYTKTMNIIEQKVVTISRG